MRGRERKDAFNSRLLTIEEHRETERPIALPLRFIGDTLWKQALTSTGWSNDHYEG
jgi:hypothetical protein